MPSAIELARSSGLIFTGTVVDRGRSEVPLVPASPELLIVRVDRGLKVDAVHGDLSGRQVTVLPVAPAELEPGQQAVFFTNSWIHGQGIAVREVAHVDVAEEGAVAEAIAELPRVQLRERLQAAELVAQGEVAELKAVERTSFARNAPEWLAATLRITRVLRGETRDEATLYFPTSNHPLWARAPRLEEHQRGVFLPHRASRVVNVEQAGIAADTLVVVDPDDVQPESRLDELEQLLAGAPE